MDLFLLQNVIVVNITLEKWKKNLICGYYNQIQSDFSFSLVLFDIM